MKLSSGGASLRHRRARARLEYDILSRLQIDGVIGAVELISEGDVTGLVVDDHGLITLAESVRNGSWPVLAVVDLAIAVTKVLTEVHAAGVVHCDLNPRNILVDPRTRRPTLIDFDISTTLASEQSRPWGVNSANGTPLYMSPEQTGRMNRHMDYRTDYYSLGATLYELLAGRPPFEAADPLAIVHAHIARLPHPVHEVAKGVPEPLSDIVLKLLSKNAEDRYQTAEGLLVDLIHCQEALRRGVDVPAFEVGRGDVSSTFRIPEKLYGREGEFEKLASAFAEVSQGAARIVIVAGEAGIGKTSLVSELYKPLAQTRGYFASGKFDQFNRGLPHSALTLAFGELVRQLLAESEDRIAQWRQELHEALGGAAHAIVELIPELELILGPSAPVPELSGIEAQNRMKLLFQRCLGVFATTEHPLVLFLDDLQWADAAFFKLLEVMLTGDAPLLLVGTYRTEEVGPGHPLQAALDGLREKGAPLETVVLEPLAEDDVESMISDALGSRTGESQALSRLVHRKTGGNPFFVRQLLTTLHERGLVVFQPTTSRWLWSTDEIERVGVTDNVVHLMLDRLRDLPTEAQDALTWAACVGNVCDLRTIALVRERSERETALALLPAVDDGLLVPIGDGHKFFLSGGDEAADVPDGPGTRLEVRYRFLHDRVQQAAYSLIPSGTRAEAHLKIGRSLREQMGDDVSSEQLFALVNHLNHAQDEIENAPERLALAELNLLAGQMAKAATAYNVAQQYLSAGIRLLPDNAWQSHYDLTLKLHSEGAEVAYLNADVSLTESLVQEVLGHARESIDKASIYETRVQALVARQELLPAVETALQALAELGLRLPANPGPAHVLLGFARTKLALRGRTAEGLRELPAMSDPTKLALLRVLMTATAPVYFARPNLFPLIAFEMVKLSVRYGNAPYSAYGYGIYGVLLCAAFNDVPRGYAFGKLGIEILDTFNVDELRAKVNLVFHSSIKPWRDPLEETLAPLLEGYTAGLETGDLEYATLSGVTHCIRSMYAGRELGPIGAKMEFHIGSARRFGQEKYWGLIRLARQALDAFTTSAAEPWSLKGEFFRGDEELRRLQEAKDESTLCVFYVFRAMTAYAFGEVKEAVEAGMAAEPYLPAQTGTPHPAVHHFYAALALLQLLREHPEDVVSRARRKIAKFHKALRRWAEHAPANFQHRVDLVAAEWARLEGDAAAAIRLYDEAIKGAMEAGYTQEEALANEIAGVFHLQEGRPRIASVYLREAREGWGRWGASAKVEQLDERFSGMEGYGGGVSVERSADVSVSGSGGAASLDLNTVLRATQSITRELDLDRLLGNLIDLVIQNAGAQRGVLLLDNRGQLFIEARKDADAPVEVAQADPLDGHQDISVGIVKYVARTRESVVLHDAIRDRLFEADPYVQRKKPRSILCTPLLDQGRLVGVLYLENNLTPGAFTEERLELLQVLSAQIALSLGNARLYGEMEAKVAERTNELARINDDLTQALGDLRKTQSQLVHSEKMASLGQLTAGIAHEIKNPLNFVNNFAQNLDEMMDEFMEELEERKEATVASALGDLQDLVGDLKAAAQMVNKHGQRADAIVKGMMRHARTSDAGRTRISLNRLVEQYITLAHHGAKARGEPAVEVHTAFGEEVGEVEVVEQEIGRVLINLLDNAYHAVTQHQREGVPPRIAVATRVVGDWLEVEVADNGPGVSPDVRDRVFEPFFSTKPTGDGTGLGLSLSYEIVVQQHGGQIELLDAEGGGARFVIRLRAGETPTP